MNAVARTATWISVAATGLVWIMTQGVARGQPSAVVDAVAAVETRPVHPLDPLSPEEVTVASAVVRAARPLGEHARFAYLALYEPTKHVLHAHRAGDAVERRAFAVILDRSTGRTFEALVDVSARRLLSFDERPGVQPMILEEEYAIGASVVRADPAWQAAMRRRGLKDEQFEDVALDLWAAGATPEHAGRRLLRAVAYYRGDAINQYPRVIEGVVALVDMTVLKVIDLHESAPVPIPTDSVDFFDAAQRGTPRKPLAPLETRQPEGANFVLLGNEVQWQGWSLRYSFNIREGLVLHSISHADGDQQRAILHRASLSEMLVPYGDPSPAWRWRNAFDVGEYGLGASLTPLRLGHETPEHATLLEVTVADPMGQPRAIPNAIALYEQDAGLLWMHRDYETQRVETRRARQLVLHTVYTVGNYEYSLRWLFGQDGGIELRVELTGIVLVRGVDQEQCAACREAFDEEGRLIPTGADRYGTLVAPRIVATNHQHFFSFRLDLDVDGMANTAVETEFVPVKPGPDNPAGNGFVVQQRALSSEREGQRDQSLAGRGWRVVNPNHRTKLGHAPGFELVPGAHALPLADPTSSVRQRGGFVGHQLWVTRFQPAERYAAGDYPNQSVGGEGLPRFVANDEPLRNQDVVLWYTLGLSHAARAEDWPVMPVSQVGFRLVPHNFFDRNPALDVP